MRFSWLAACALLIPLNAACGNSADPAAADASLTTYDAAPVIPPDASCAEANLETFFADSDGDGFGDPNLIAVDCEAPPGFVAVADDCNDKDPWVFPSGDEVCDGVDNDCDPATVESCANGCSPQLSEDEQVRYLFCTSQRNQTTAAQACATEGMHLVSINDEAEQVFVFGRRTALWGTSFVSWLSGTDEVDGTWLWHDETPFWLGNAGGAPVDDRYAHWRSGEPGGGGGERCMLMDNEGSTGRWDDRGCGEDRRFICERPLTPSP